jgi:hypothetical protein
MIEANMTDRFFHKNKINNSRVARPISSRVFRWLVLIAGAGTLLSAGFIMSARQHFDAVKIGYESEELRREALRLEEKRRQLELERAREASPAEVERRAKRLGLTRPSSKQSEIRRPVQSLDDKKKPN